VCVGVTARLHLTLLKPKMHFGLTPTYPTGGISVMIPTRHLCWQMTTTEAKLLDNNNNNNK
jgi:hypothetical protein